jgi:hypothetical protein
MIDTAFTASADPDPERENAFAVLISWPLLGGPVFRA